MSTRRQNSSTSSSGSENGGNSSGRRAVANGSGERNAERQSRSRENAQNLNRANSASPSPARASGACASPSPNVQTPKESQGMQANAAAAASNQSKAATANSVTCSAGAGVARSGGGDRSSTPSKNNPMRHRERRERELEQQRAEEDCKCDDEGSGQSGWNAGEHPHSVMFGNHKAAARQAAPEPAAQPVVLPVVPQAPRAAGNDIPYNWQASKTTIKERLAYMFNSEIMADVHFVVGKNDNLQRIPAHKFVLSIGSAVFDAMFNGGMATTAAEVDLPDVEPSAFLALLRFLYSDEVQIGPETVMTTLYTAKKYAVPALERACVDFLKRNLSSDNAFMLLTQARLFDEPQLAALCLETIDKNTNEALAAEGFTDIDLDTLCVVLERDTLGIREGKLFTAVCRWSEAECMRQELPVTSENKRTVLGRAMQLIRFPLMTVEEFAVGAAQSGILTDREVVELFLHFTVNPKPSVGFLDTPRCCLTGKEQVVSRFGQIESRWGYSGTSDRIR